MVCAGPSPCYAGEPGVFRAAALKSHPPRMALPPLSPEQLVKPRHFELRLALIFAALYVPIGVNVPYFPLWLEALGFSAERISVILAVPMFLRVITTPLISAYADRARDRVDVLLVLVGLSVVIACGYFLEPVYAVVLAVSLAFSIVWAPQAPLADSLALSGVRRFGSNYTRMRIWGSITFLLANLGGGFILSKAGAQAVPALIAGTLALAFLVVLIAPRLGKPRRASPLSMQALRSAMLFNRRFLLFMAGSGLIAGSHGLMYGFASIYWKSIGIGDSVIGLLWGFGVVAEVGIFAIYNSAFRRLSATSVMLIAGLAAIVRWIAYPLVWPAGLGLAGLFAVQGLHCLSMGLSLIAVQKEIAETVPEEQTGAAQGAAYFANGTCMAVVTLLSGPLYARLGPWSFEAMIVVAALGTALIYLAGRAQPQSAGSGADTSEPS